MADTNVERLADTLLDYSFEMVDFEKAWKRDKKRLWLRFKPPADELARVITEKIFEKGGNVFLDQEPSWKDFTFFTKASDDVLERKPDFHLYKLEHSAARLVILSDSNTKALANVNPKRRTMWSKTLKPYSNAAMSVDEKGNFLTPWCGAIFPTEAYAQDMEMSLAECKEYIYKAMYLDEKNPAKEWKRVAKGQKKMLKEVLNKAHQLTIIDEADDTKLDMSVKGHRWIISDGHVNFPSDEIFNAPRKTSVNGVLEIPSLSQYDHGGPEVRGIKLEFRDGKVIKWEADVGKSYLDEFLTKNPGANYLGEIAFGRHPRINRISKQILLDEKMGGTLHFALGRAYKLHVLGNGDKSGLNESVRHWDLIRDMRKATAYVEIDGTIRLIWDDNVGQWKTESQ
ncbi:MAG: aminopeptidase [Candidatus Bathyarchaeota archaeon]|nr:MAG: aminopeptidase [Candidatus Bathyarchaeota archaeon]